MFGCSMQQAQHEEALKKLADEFSNPPVSARPRAYWNWLNGDVSLSGITIDLEEAKEKGLADCKCGIRRP